MLIILSPAKKLDYETPASIHTVTQGLFLPQAQALIDVLKKLSPQEIATLMHLSDSLSVLNYDRYQAWKLPFEKAKQAIFAFKGDVYEGLEAYKLSPADLEYAQQHLRILSGLYGVLRPFDLMLPYRLEMGTKISTSQGADLYDFWQDSLTKQVSQDLINTGSEWLVNLASQEYFKSIQPDQVRGKIVSPVFKDWKNGQYKIISFYAKKARGMMAGFLIRHQVNRYEHLLEFEAGGYAYNKAITEDKSSPVFTRKF